MEVIAISTGSWFPRTKLHLKEYFTFLRQGTSHLPIDKNALKKAHAALMPHRIAYQGGRFDRVTADMGDFQTTYYEDGILVIDMAATGDTIADAETIRDFYENRLAAGLALIYSIGTPTVMPSPAHDTRQPIFIKSKNATEAEAIDLLHRLGETNHQVARHAGITLYYADRTTIIDGGDELADQLIAYLLFFRQYEHKLSHFLDTHRSAWESIDRIRSKEMLTVKELPGIRDRLLDYGRDFSILRARLSQMEAYLDERRSEIDDLGLTQTMRELEAYRFAHLHSATRYIDRLWSMFQDYLSSTIEITGLMYQENLQKEINLQQFIFLLSAVATVLTLGAIPGSQLVLYGPDGARLATGEIAGFAWSDLLRMGGLAILATAVVFAIVRPLASSFRRVHAVSLLGGNRNGKAESPTAKK